MLKPATGGKRVSSGVGIYCSLLLWCRNSTGASSILLSGISSESPRSASPAAIRRLKAYLDTGKKGEKPVAKRYLCRSRRPLYAQEHRPAAPIVCTYMGGSRAGAKPFGFLLNHSQATACNFFLMLYPKPFLAAAAAKNPQITRTVWEFLNGIEPEALLGHGRVTAAACISWNPRNCADSQRKSCLRASPKSRPCIISLIFWQMLRPSRSRTRFCVKEQAACRRGLLESFNDWRSAPTIRTLSVPRRHESPQCVASHRGE